MKNRIWDSGLFHNIGYTIRSLINVQSIVWLRILGKVKILDKDNVEDLVDLAKILHSFTTSASVTVSILTS